jgi:hypothetical protein
MMATAYPYTAGIIAVIWLGSVILLKIDSTLSFKLVIFVNVALTALFASIGFKR